MSGKFVPRRAWQRFAAMKTGCALLALALLMNGTPPETQAQASAPLVPIINGYGLLLGASRGGRWVPWEKIHPLLKGGEKYRFYNGKGLTNTLTGSKPELAPASGAAYYIRFPDRKEDESTEGLVGVGGTWNPMPRQAKKESSQQNIYKDAVAAILKEKGLPNAKPNITRVLRVDLFGKGQEAVLIEAASPNYSLTDGADGKPPPPNAYSVVLLRLLVNAKVKTFVLDGTFKKKPVPSEPPEKYEIRNVLDLNGDGILEILVDNSYYEGGGTRVYDLKSGVPKMVIESSDGA